MRKLTIVATCAAALGAAGCGIADPYHPSARPAAPSARRQPAPRQSAPAAGARQALEQFGRVWVNWRSESLAPNRRQLAALATGDLAGVLADDAKRAATDATQAAPRWRNTGTVQAVVLRDGGRALVVTQETTAREGQAGEPAYVVYLATVESTTDGWKVSEWQRTS